MKDITIPDIGDFHDVEVIDVLVKPGDRVEKETPLVTLETEKATMDVPSSEAGVVKAISVRKGDRVSKGSVIVQVEEGAQAAAPADASPESPPAKKEAKEPSKPPSAPLASDPAHVPAAEEVKSAPASSAPKSDAKPAPAIDEPGFARAYAGPSVRKLARELGADLGQVKGTGIKGRITHDD
ncbi:MAG: biotin/lipoyl-containing protein, partial [Steroidobacteraceae bacterium]